MTDQYAELPPDAEIARLRGDLDFERRQPLLDAPPYAKLTDVARRFGVSASGAHNALADVRITLAVPTWWTIPAASRRYVSTTCWRPASSARPPIRTALGIGPDASDE